MSSIQGRLDQAMASKDIEALDALFNQVKDISTLSRQTSKTPTELLPWAVLANNIESIKDCLQLGALVTFETEVNAQINSGLKIYRLLVPAGLDVNRDLGYAGTALTGAIAANDLDLTAYLLEVGANPNVGSLNGSSALELVINEYLPTSVAKSLIDHGAEFPTSGLIILATLTGNDTMVDFLARSGANVNETTDQSFVTGHRGKRYTALHLAVLEGACYDSTPDVVEVLLRHGADRTARDVNDKTALELAKESGQTELVSLLQ